MLVCSIAQTAHTHTTLHTHTHRAHKHTTRRGKSFSPHLSSLLSSSPLISSHLSSPLLSPLFSSPLSFSLLSFPFFSPPLPSSPLFSPPLLSSPLLSPSLFSPPLLSVRDMNFLHPLLSKPPPQPRFRPNVVVVTQCPRCRGASAVNNDAPMRFATRMS